MKEQFRRDVEKGLNTFPKVLSSKYFYDKKGSALFVEIMHSSEYYLTRAELDIFTNQTQNIIDALGVNQNTYFELIELGAGDGLKTKELLKSLDKQNYEFDYLPVDICEDSLKNLEESINKEYPNISIKRKQGDYFDVLELLKDSCYPKVVLFLGSNLGNMTDSIANEFIHKLGNNLNPNDKLILGLDLIKSKSKIFPAYSDSKGITRDFNLNLLQRINQELDANFEISKFSHQPEYSEKDGIIKSFFSE